MLALLLPAGIWIAKRYFNIEVGTHFGVFITPIIGILAVWLGFIRFGAFIKQNRADALNRCIEQINNQDSASMRIAGIRGLVVLAQGSRDDTEFLKQVCDILQGFIDKYAPPRPLDIMSTVGQATEQEISRDVRDAIRVVHLSEAEASEVKEWNAHWQEHKAEVAQAICTFAIIAALDQRTLPNLDLSNRYMPYLQLPEQKHSTSSLRGADLHFSLLLGAILSNADLKEAGLRETNLREADLTNTDLRGVSCMNTDLSGAELENADLRKTNLMGANLEGVHLRDTNLKGANLSGRDLMSAFLWKTDLREANLKETNMQMTGFCEAKLKNADFAKARMAGSVYHEMGNTRFTRGKSVTPEWLKEQGALNTDKAKFSDDSEN